MYSRAQEISINWLSTWGAGGPVLELPTTRIHYSGMFQTNLRNDKNYSLEEKVWKEMDGKKKKIGREQEAMLKALSLKT